MNKQIIRLTSVTYAIRAQRLLEQRGIRSYMKKLSNTMSVHGCGYGLEVSGESLRAAVDLIAGAGIRIVEIVEATQV